MHRMTLDEFVAGLQKLGIRQGDLVHVQSDLRRIGPVDAVMKREPLCDFYLRGFKQALGPDGTLTVCTAFEDYGRYGHTFDRDQSPSRTDTFSEFVRTQPDAVRSCHPIVSVAGVGARASEICDAPHFNGFGWESPWGRLHRANAKILSLGIGWDVEGGMTFLHYVEQLYGVPYQYTKMYDAPVVSGGQVIQGPFTMSVRYLDFGILNEPFAIKRRLLDDHLAVESRIGSSMTWCGSAQDIVKGMCSYMNENRWIYLNHPPHFRRGEIPCDGPTGAMQAEVDKATTAPGS